MNFETSPANLLSPIAHKTSPPCSYSPSSQLLLENNHFLGTRISRPRFQPRRTRSPMYSPLTFHDQNHKSLHAQQNQVTPRQQLGRSSSLPCSGPPPQEKQHKRGKHKAQLFSRAFGNCCVGASSNTQRSCFPLYFQPCKQLLLKRPRYLSLGSSPTKRSFTACLSEPQQTDKSTVSVRVTDMCRYLEAPHDSTTSQSFLPKTLLVDANSG